MRHGVASVAKLPDKADNNSTSGVSDMFCTNTVDWLYKLEKDYVWKSPCTHEKNWGFEDENGVLRLKLLSDGHIIVMAGYCWDGCTPKFCFMDVLLGTPEGAILRKIGTPKTWDASLIHDALCQFLPAEMPLTQKEIDDCMLELLQMRGFALSYFYYGAVRLFGWFTKPATQKIRGIKGGKRIELTAEQAVFEASEDNT